MLNNLPAGRHSRDETSAIDSFTERALDLISSLKARNAFDISLESEETRAKYGAAERYRIYGGPYGVYDGSILLQARRLVEAGVPVVTVRVGG